MVDPQLAAAGSEEARLLGLVDPARLPRHLAIIMDGNGRWAGQRHLPRAAGHHAGVAAVREVVEVVARLGIESLTLYAFSQENWRRPASEVRLLMSLLQEYVRREIDELVRNNVRLSTIGRLEELPDAVRADLQWALAATAPNTGLHLCIALSYAGRTEIIDACRAILRSGLRAEEIDDAVFARHLYAPGQADPDLLIRTSGERRLSNFMLWQLAYTELWITTTLWPDFRRRQLFEALIDYQSRERRFGGLGATALAQQG